MNELPAPVAVLSAVGADVLCFVPAAGGDTAPFFIGWQLALGCKEFAVSNPVAPMRYEMRPKT